MACEQRRARTRDGLCGTKQYVPIFRNTYRPVPSVYTLKTNIPIAYPVHTGLAYCYGQLKGVNPNEEFSVWSKSRKNTKWLLLAFFILALVISGTALAFKSIKGAGGFGKKSNEESVLFMVAMPGIISFMAISFISLSLFEQWNAKRKALKNINRFNGDYERFMAAINATHEEIQRWPEETLKRACIAVLEAERTKIDKMKTSRGKLSRLAKFIELYEPMNSIGLRFESVDAYIRHIRITTRPKAKVTKPPKVKPSKPKTTKKKEKVVLEPVA
jgi:hypothetical protein